MPEQQKDKKSKHEIEVEKLRTVRQQGEQILDTLKGLSEKDIKSEIYLEMDNYIDMVALGISTGVVIEGKGGSGKTWRSISRCNHHKVSIGYTDSYTTPSAFYVWLFKNRNKDVLIVDDCAGFMSNDKILAFLKGGLWEVNGKRIITYMTTKPLKDDEGDFVPSTCELNARMIIITNQLNKKSSHLQAVLTRVNYCYVEIPRDELLNIMGQIAQKEYDGLSMEERMEVFNFLKDNTTTANTDLNIRTLLKSFQYKIYSNQIKDNNIWKQLILKNLKQDEDILIVEQLMDNPAFDKEEDRVTKFSELTGKGRATYFRLKEKIGK